MRLKGAVYKEYPELLALKQQKRQMNALGRAQIVPPGLLPLLTQGMYSSPFPLFNTQLGTQLESPTVQHERASEQHQEQRSLQRK